MSEEIVYKGMPYRPLGRSGLRLSALALGGWTTFGGSVRDRGLVRQIIHRAFERGINFFDIADVYARGESERMMGEVLRELPRHELVISSKVFWPMSDDPNDRGLSRKHIVESVHKSLKRIGVDYLDLYFCHRYDPSTPLEETARAMDDLVRQGKVLYWGTSEWEASQLEAVHALCEDKGLYPPQVEQPQYHLLARQRVEGAVAPVAQKLGMGMVTWSPLASGMLSGKYDEGVPEGTRLAQIEWLRDLVRTEANVERVRRMKTLAEQHGCTRAQLAIAWVMAQPGVSSVILGATSMAQLEENLGALEPKLSEASLRELDALFPRG